MIKQQRFPVKKGEYDMTYRILNVIFCFFLLTPVIWSQDKVALKLDQSNSKYFKKSGKINPNDISDYTILNNNYQKSYEYWLWDKSISKIPGFEYKIMMDKKQYFIDEPICSTEIFSNSSGKHIFFPIIPKIGLGYFPASAIKVQYVTSSKEKINASLTSSGMKIYERKHQDYKKLQDGTYILNYSGPGPRLIPDQKEYIAQWSRVPLNTLFNMTLPGKYAITFGRVIIIIDNKWLFLASNTITIEVLSKNILNHNYKNNFTSNTEIITDIGALENAFKE
jgi:hypothetical protein